MTFIAHFTGGPLDGQVKQLTELRPDITVAVFPPLASYGAGAPDEPVRFVDVTYRLDKVYRALEPVRASYVTP